MKKIIILCCSALFSFALVYLLGAFFNVSFNIEKW